MQRWRCSRRRLIPELRQRTMALGAEPVGKSVTEFEAKLKADYEATAKLVAQIGLRVD